MENNPQAKVFGWSKNGNTNWLEEYLASRLLCLKIEEKMEKPIQSMFLPVIKYNWFVCMTHSLVSGEMFIITYHVPGGGGSRNVLEVW